MLSRLCSSRSIQFAMQSPLPLLLSLLFLFLAGPSQALRFELPAQDAQHVQPRCIRNYVNRDILVVVAATVSGNRGDGQRVNIDVLPSPSWAGC